MSTTLGVGLVALGMGNTTFTQASEVHIECTTTFATVNTWTP